MHSPVSDHLDYSYSGNIVREMKRIHPPLFLIMQMLLSTHSFLYHAISKFVAIQLLILILLFA